MEKIGATTAHSSAHHAASAPDRTGGRASENRTVEAGRNRDEHARKVIDSRPSQAHLKFQESLHSTRAKADLKTAT